MTYVVAKSFKTANRRFTVGSPISPDDVIGAVSFDAWEARGFIVNAVDNYKPQIAEAYSTMAKPSTASRRYRRNR